MIKLQNITKVYETQNHNVIALSDVNYNMDQGEVIVILGKSGSGKSTLLNIVGGFDRDYAGEYLLDNEDIKQKTDREVDEIRKRKIGFIFQNYVLLQNLTVVENVALALNVIGVVNQSSRKRAALHALKLVGLRDHAEKYPYQLSGGQKQRVAIARAFVKNPSIIIADEPTAALDTATSKEIMDLLVDLSRNKLLLIATHNKSIVRDYGTRVIELKSGYTIKDELISDPSKVRVDELDLIIDDELDSRKELIEKMMQVDPIELRENPDSVLESLGVDLSNFRHNVENKFFIDEELKKQMIQERMKNTSLNTRIIRFLQTTDSFYGKKRYARQSFFRNMGLHIFSSVIFAAFLLIIVLAFNFVSTTFSGFNEQSIYARLMTNQNTVYYAESSYDLEFEDQSYYEDLKLEFIASFAQTEIASSPFLDKLFEDPYVQYQYDQEKITYLNDEINDPNSFNIYYNNSVVLELTQNDALLFDTMNQQYSNLTSSPTPFTRVTAFMDNSLDPSFIYQYNYLFYESNQEIFSEHLLEGSSAPIKDNEVVIPVSALFDYEILYPDDFKDEYGNTLEIIPANDIMDAFMALDDSIKYITIEKSILTFEEIDGETVVSIDTEEIEFKIVGIMNFDGDLNPFIAQRQDIYVANNAPTFFSFLFSSSAKNQVTFDIVDLVDDAKYVKSIQYATINDVDYEKYNVAQLESDFDEIYINQVKEAIQEDINTWITDLNNASELVAEYVQNDLTGQNPSNTFMNNEFSSYFPGLTYQDLLDYYVVQHTLMLSNQIEYNYLADTPYSARTFELLLNEADSIYLNAKNSSAYRDMLEVYGDTDRLTYQEATNRMIYDTYASRFNTQFYESSINQVYSLDLYSSFEREYGSLLNLIFVFVPREFINILPFADGIIEAFERLESSDGFRTFLQVTNLDLILSSLSTNAVKSAVILALFIVVYVIMTLSVILLSIVLMSLYANVYESATRRRVSELASLRVLGASYEDLLSMIKLENRWVASFSYGLFVLSMIFISSIELVSQSPIDHFYMPLLGVFFSFNIYDIANFNVVVIIVATLLFYFLIVKWIIKRVSTRKIINIDTIKAIRDGDNL
jgi:ABC-type lipoprotein export system ATPase subunit